MSYAADKKKRSQIWPILRGGRGEMSTKIQQKKSFIDFFPNLAYTHAPSGVKVWPNFDSPDLATLVGHKYFGRRPDVV